MLPVSSEAKTGCLRLITAKNAISIVYMCGENKVTHKVGTAQAQSLKPVLNASL